MAASTLEAPSVAPMDAREHEFLGLRMRLFDWALLVGLWTLPGIITTALIHFMKSEGWFMAALTQLPPWLYWVPATPAIVRLTRARPLDSTMWVRNLPLHLLATAALSLGQIAIATGSCKTFGGVTCRAEPLEKVLWSFFVYYAELNVVCYWGIVAFGSAIDWHRRFRDRELAAAKLETALVSAQLEALKVQLQPHFLFNTLHAIGVLVRKGDQQGSLRMLAGVGDLLRLTIDANGRSEVSLKDELDFVDRYLEVERVRFQGRLRVVREIDSAVLDAAVPNLLLQPIVENAIRHGIEAKSEAGTIRITAKREGGRLRIEIADDGIGPGKSARAGKGVGLSNVRARLEQLHPGANRVELAAGPAGGAIVTVEMPFRGTQEGMRA